jgi:hypothetical protein
MIELPPRLHDNIKSETLRRRLLSCQTRHPIPLHLPLSPASLIKKSLTPPCAVSASPCRAAVHSPHSTAPPPYPTVPGSVPPREEESSGKVRCQLPHRLSSYWTQSPVPRPKHSSSMCVLGDCSGASVPGIPCRARPPSRPGQAPGEGAVTGRAQARRS